MIKVTSIDTIAKVVGLYGTPVVVEGRRIVGVLTEDFDQYLAHKTSATAEIITNNGKGV